MDIKIQTHLGYLEMEKVSIDFSFKQFGTVRVTKVLMQGKLFQMCTHFLYCSVLSLGGKVNTRRMSQPDRESIFTKKSMKYSGHRKLS